MKKLFPFFVLLLLWIAASTVSVAQSIAKAEYFIDQDPGVGSATSFNPNESDFVVPISQLSRGIHNIYFRAMDTRGRWGTISSQPFYAYIGEIANNNVQRIEYYIDQDPGIGNAKPLDFMNAQDGTAEIAAQIPLQDISAGIHTLYIRTLDKKGVWGNVTASAFYCNKGNGTGTARIEYFFDQDPGLGKGTAISNNGNEQQDISVDLPLATAPFGFHTLYVRCQDKLGRWSSLYSSAFMHLQGEKENTIAAVEYFFDTDPGVGNGYKAQNIAPPNSDFTTDFVFEPEVPNVFKSGEHTLYIRGIDARGRWGIMSMQSFNYQNVSILEIDKNLNQSTYDVLLNGIVHIYYRLVNERNEPIENAILYYKLNKKEYPSKPSDALGMIDLFVKTGGDDYATTSDDWLSKLDTSVITLSRVEINSAITKLSSANQFSPITLNMDDFKGKIKSGYGIAGSLSLGVGLEGEQLFGVDNLEFTPLNLGAKATLGTSFSSSEPYIEKGKSYIDLEFNAELEGKLEAELLSIELGSGSPKNETNGKSAPKFFDASINLSNGVEFKATPTVKSFLTFPIENNTNIGLNLLYYVAYSDRKYSPASYLVYKVLKAYLSKQPVLPKSSGYGWGMNVSGKVESSFDLKFGLGGASLNLKAIGVDASSGNKNEYELTEEKGKIKIKDKFTTFGEFNFEAANFSLGFGSEAYKFKKMEILPDLSLGTSNKSGTSFEHSAEREQFLGSDILNKTGFKVGRVEEIDLDRIPVLRERFAKQEYSRNLVSTVSKNLQPPSNIFSKYGVNLTNRELKLFDTQNQPELNSLFRDFTLSVEKEIKENKSGNLGAADYAYKRSVRYSQLRTASISFEELQKKILFGFSFKAGIDVGFKFKTYGSEEYEEEIGKYNVLVDSLVPTITYPNYKALEVLNNRLGEANYILSLINNAQRYVSERIDLLAEEAKKIFNDGITSIKNGVKEFTNSLRNSEQFQRNQVRVKNNGENFSSITFSYKDDGSVFPQSTNVQMKYFFTEGEVRQTTVDNDTFVLVSDVFYFSATNNQDTLEKSPNGKFNITTQVGQEDLAFLGFDKNSPVELMFQPFGATHWRSLGAANSKIAFDSLGVYTLAVRLQKDTIPPTITVLHDTLVQKKGKIKVVIKDTQSGIKWNKVTAKLDFENIPNRRVAMSDTLLIERDSLPKNLSGEYVLSFSAKDNADNITYLNTVVKFDAITSNKGIVIEEKIVGIYPNPAQAEAKVFYNLPDYVNGQLRLNITDVSGRSLGNYVIDGYTAGLNQYIIDVSNFKNGLYIVSLIGSKGQIHTQKMVIQH